MRREPALVIVAVHGLLTMLSTFAVRGIDEELAAAVQVLLTAIATAVTAMRVRPWAPTIFTGIIVAATALAARFGFQFDEVQIASITTFVAAVVTLAAARPQQSPVAPTGRTLL